MFDSFANEGTGEVRFQLVETCCIDTLRASVGGFPPQAEESTMPWRGHRSIQEPHPRTWRPIPEGPHEQLWIVSVIFSEGLRNIRCMVEENLKYAQRGCKLSGKIRNFKG